DRDDRPLPDRRPGRGLPARRRPRRRGRGAGPRRGRRDPARRHGDRRGDPPGRERPARRRRLRRRGRDRRVDHARPRRGGADDDRHAAVQHPRRRPRPGGPRRGMTAAPVPAPPAEVLGVPWPGRCLVMGILNVTPDSFSDGGDHLAPESAIARGLELMRDGADLVDVGGESTRPGAAPVPVDVELARVVPVVRALAEHGVPVSVDTTKAAVAAEAVAAGARVVNDVSGGLADETMVELVAALAVPYVVMHWRAPSAEMRRHARYGDVVAEVREELGRRLDAVTAAGVDPELIVLDPGLGFAK